MLLTNTVGKTSAEGEEDDDAAAIIAAAAAKSGASSSTPTASDEPAADATAKSLKCSDCGKIFRGTAQVQFHAHKTGHENFEESTEEIKPLTEEEKTAKLEELRIRLAEKRAKQAELDKVDNKKNELIRRKAGQDMTEVKQALAQKEMDKEVEARKRAKKEELAAKQRVKDQIEADKRARRERAEKEKAARAGIVETPHVAVVAAPAAAAPSTASRAEARLSIRPKEGGAPIVRTFKSEVALSEVAEYVQETVQSPGPIRFATTFPRRVFTEADMSKTLKELGLSPSSVLMMQ